MNTADIQEQLNDSVSASARSETRNDQGGVPALQKAILDKDDESVKEILQEEKPGKTVLLLGDEKQKTALHYAAQLSTEIVRQITELETCDKSVLLAQDYLQRIPLHFALCLGAIQSAVCILTKARSIGCLEEVLLATDVNGQTALHHLVLSPDVKDIAAEPLLEFLSHKVLQATCDESKLSVLHCAIITKKLEFFKVVMNGPCCDSSFLLAADEDGNTLLHKAVMIVCEYERRGVSADAGWAKMFVKAIVASPNCTSAVLEALNNDLKTALDLLEEKKIAPDVCACLRSEINLESLVSEQSSLHQNLCAVLNEKVLNDYMVGNAKKSTQKNLDATILYTPKGNPENKDVRNFFKNVRENSEYSPTDFHTLVTRELKRHGSVAGPYYKRLIFCLKLIKRAELNEVKPSVAKTLTML